MGFLWLVVLFLGVIIGPALTSGIGERFQSPGTNRHKDKDHLHTISKATVDNEIERVRVHNIYRGT